MSKMLALSEDTYERLLALAQEYKCTPEEFLRTLLVTAEQAQYYHATKRPPAKSWWVQKLSADFTAD